MTEGVGGETSSSLTGARISAGGRLGATSRQATGNCPAAGLVADVRPSRGAQRLRGFGDAYAPRCRSAGIGRSQTEWRRRRTGRAPLSRRPLTSGAPVAFSTLLASGRSARRSGRKPVARMTASKRSGGDCLKATPSGAKLVTSPRSAIRPSRIASSVPMSMSGTRPSSSIACSGPLAERLRPSVSMEPIANRSNGALMMSAIRAGNHSAGETPGEDRDAEQFARDDVDRAADRERHVDPRFGEVERDLGARIAVAYDQRTFPGERGRIAINARMEEFPAERLHARPCRRVRIGGPSGRDDHDRSGSRVLARFRAPCPSVAPDRANRRVERPASGRTVAA